MLTRAQQRAYDFIVEFISSHDYAPTTEEIAHGINIKSKGVAHRYVKALVKEGYINIIPKRHRNIQLPEAVNDAEMLLPIIGEIAAGSPIEAIEDNRTLNIATTLLGAQRYILQVKGDSMIGDNICDGDFIICEQAGGMANDGDIVVAMIDNQEATLKRFERNSNNTVTLVPSNPHLSPMVYASDRVSVQGVYIGLLRLGNSL